MYSEESIEVLNNRIGFGKAYGLAVELSEENLTATSGRRVTYFSKMANTKSLYHTVEEIDMSESNFNDYLDELRKEAVKSVLTDLMHKNELYRDSFDYSDTIIKKPELFDDCIGFALAISMIDQMVSSSRLNSDERNVNLKYDKLKIELQGAKDTQGNTIAVGIFSKYRYALKKSAKILFPNPIKVEAIKYW